MKTEGALSTVKSDADTNSGGMRSLRDLLAWLGRWDFLWLVLPALALYGLFVLYPSGLAARLSLFDWSGIGRNMNFIGLANYSRMLASPDFWHALGHTVVFFLSIAFLQSTVGLGLAMLLAAQPRFHQGYRIILFLPVTLSLVNTGFIWQLMLSAQFGLVNPMLKAIGLGFLARPWLADLQTALPAVIMVQAWQWMGLPIVVFLAGLQNVRQDLVESAQLEGAGRWATFKDVTFPQLAPAFTAITMLSFIRMFKVFDVVYVLEGITGSPAGRTSTLATVIYSAAFGSGGAYSTVFEMSYAMAIALASSFVLLILSAVMIMYLRRREADLY
jgi:raffinose/stachyose/melibiose transport system permease protein